MTTTAFDLFACEPHRVRLTTKSCAANWKMVNSGTKTTMPGTAMTGTGSHASRAYGRIVCVNCEIGAAHARGEVVPVERLVWKQPAKAAPPPPPPVTIVPRVEGVLDDKTAKPTPVTAWDRELAAARAVKASVRARERDIEPEPGPRWDEPLDELHAADAADRMHAARGTTPEPTMTTTEETQPMTRTAHTEEERDALIADVLTKQLTIDAYADKHRVNQATIRMWLEKRGHDPKTWPKGTPGRPSHSARPTRTVTSLAERAEVVGRALEKKLSIEMYAKAENVGPSALRSWLVIAGHNPLDWPTTSQANAAALARSRAAIEEEEAEHAKATPATTARAKLTPADLHDLERDMAAELTRHGVHIDDDEPSIGDVVPELAPRAMDRTELALEEPPPSPEPTPPSPFFNDGADAGDFPGDEDFPPFPDEAVDTPIPFKPALVNPDPVRALMGVALVVPVRIGTLIAQLDVSAHVAHVIQSVYMAGLAHGRDMLDETVFWTEHAAEHARRVEFARGAA